MAETKTKPSLKSVAAFLGSVEGEHRRRDAAVLASLMERVTGEPPILWGETIVGFGRYHYKYASGTEAGWRRSGNACFRNSASTGWASLAFM